MSIYTSDSSMGILKAIICRVFIFNLKPLVPIAFFSLQKLLKWALLGGWGMYVSVCVCVAHYPPEGKYNRKSFSPYIFFPVYNVILVCSVYNVILVFVRSTWFSLQDNVGWVEIRASEGDNSAVKILSPLENFSLKKKLNSAVGFTC